MPRRLTAGRKVTDMRKVKLTQGKYALVDNRDFKRVSRWRWYANRYRGTFYAVRNIVEKGKAVTVLLHRFIVSAGPKEMVDHVNHNGLDNRRLNLRLCSNAENLLNRRKANKNNRLGVLGVRRERGSKTWVARIIIGRKEIRSSGHKTMRSAVAARKKMLADLL